MKAILSRGFTVLEVMIVIAIVAMLAALVTVPMTGHLKGAEVEGAASRVQTTLSDAQAEARETGKPVRVVATVDEKGRAGLVCHPVETPSVAESAPEPALPSEAGMEHAFARATRRVQLPTGVTIEGGESKATSAPARSMGGLAVRLPAAAERSEQVTEPRTLAIFLPDGSAVVHGPIRLSGRDGRSSEVRVNPWTGVAMLTPEREANAATGRDERAGGESDAVDPYAEWR